MASSLRREPTTRTGLALPAKQGMYNPAFEKDACGLAMVATLRGEPGHDIVSLALEALRNLEHRGAIGSDSGTGDGAGILTQMPDAFLRAVVDFDLPPVGEYAAGLAFLPLDAEERAAVKAGVEQIAASEGLTVLGWREVPTDEEHLGKLAHAARPSSSSCSSRIRRSATRRRSRASRSTGACSGCASAPAASTTPTSSR